MRHIIAHLLGIDRELIQERYRAVQLESIVAELRESNKRLLKGYNEIKAEAVAWFSEKGRLTAELDSANQQIEAFGNEIARLKASTPRKRRKSETK